MLLGNIKIEECCQGRSRSNIWLGVVLILLDMCIDRTLKLVLLSNKQGSGETGDDKNEKLTPPSVEKKSCHKKLRV